VLTAAFAAGVLGACTAEEQAPPRVQPADPDETILAEAWAAESAMLALLDAVTSGRPRRARALAGTRAVHVAHVGLLSQAGLRVTPPPSPSPALFSGDDRAAYQAVARAEDQLGQDLRSAAFGASSGPFARVLASMAAATAQQSATVRRMP
jgi:hypothetical protein